jgi:uncharacterized membrane protein (DUF441 family)
MWSCSCVMTRFGVNTTVGHVARAHSLLASTTAMGLLTSMTVATMGTRGIDIIATSPTVATDVLTSAGHCYWHA